MTVIFFLIYFATWVKLGEKVRKIGLTIVVTDGFLDIYRSS